MAIRSHPQSFWLTRYSSKQPKPHKAHPGTGRNLREAVKKAVELFSTELPDVHPCEYFLNGGRLFNQKVCLSNISEWNTTIYKEYLREYYDEAEDGMVWLLKK